MEQYPLLLKSMTLFSNEKLRTFLGQDLVDQYVTEWGADESKQLTKKRLAEMILQLNGAEILKDQDFRLEILLHMKPREIENIFMELPANKQKNANSLQEKAQAIAMMPWSESAVNKKLLDVLGINHGILRREIADNSVIMDHMAYGRFFELLDYQFVIKQRILNILNQPYELKRMLVHMPTGTGKTKTSMHTLVNYYTFSLNQKGLVVWLAHTTELLQQAYDTFANVWAHLGKDSIRTFKVWGNRNLELKDTQIDGIMFCGIQKLQAIRQSQPEVFETIVKNVRLIVFDEAHKAAAKETRQLVESMMIKTPEMMDRSLIGLTATPGRTTLSSDENKLLSNMFEDRLIGIDVDTINKVNMTTIEYLNHSKEKSVIRYFQYARILSKMKKEELTYPETFSEDELHKIKASMTNHGYVDFNKTALEIIGKNRSRNTAIMNKLRQLAVEQIPTIVFACSVAHAKLLSLMLTLEDIPNAVVLGDMNPIDRERAITDFKNRASSTNILINYEVLTTGFDATNIECVFITRPTQSIVLYSQMLGRGLRGPKMGGNAECLLVDIKDNLGKYDVDMAFSHFDDYWN